MRLLFRLADALRHRARPAGAQANGRRSEDLVHRHLQQHGLTVVARNWRPRSGPGEIDLIAWDRDTLVFVEVKSRATDAFGSPERDVDRAKQVALARAANDYARRARVPLDRLRFDLVTLVQQPAAVRWKKDAYRLTGTL